MFQQQVRDPRSERSESSTEVKDHIFDKAWDGSDVVLVVEDVEFHVHRSILSIQSPVFKAMFEGNFKDATQEKIELKEDSYEAMYDFLRLLYPSNMLDVDKGKVSISDKNILKVLEVADKYTAVNIIKQCIREAPRLKRNNIFHLVPYAVRYEFQREEIFDLVLRRVKTEELESAMKSEPGEQSINVQLLSKKCRLLEKVIQETNGRMLWLLYNCIQLKESQSGSSVASAQPCPQHRSKRVSVQNFGELRKCENCLAVYKSCFLDKYAHLSAGGNQNRFFGSKEWSKSTQEFLDLLKLLDDIISSP